MQRFISKFTLCALTLWIGFVRPVHAGEIEKAIAQLERQTTLTHQIEPYVEQADLGRLFVLRQSSERVLDLVHTNGLAHMSTLREYQVLIVTYRYSVAYFEKIRTEITSSDIAELLQITEQIVADRGFDDSPYTKVTYSVFSQLHKLMGDLSTMGLDAQLEQAITDLLPDFGQVIALAQEGDRPHAFEAARLLYLKIRDLYPALAQIQGTDPGFNLVLNIQGLAEFYAEYAQIE